MNKKGIKNEIRMKIGNNIWWKIRGSIYLGIGKIRDDVWNKIGEKLKLNYNNVLNKKEI